MSTLLKDVYSTEFYQELSRALELVIPGFDVRQFQCMIFADGFEEKELKERMRHTTVVLHSFFPNNYADAVAMIEQLTDHLQTEGRINSFPCLFLPDYIQLYGLEDFDRSVRAIERITCFITCEFAVRPFLIKYGERMMRQMEVWAQHSDHRVRRLATEGMRPRLPWAMAVPVLKKNPEPVVRILELLKNDPHEWVRRSVANNLNDISKDHPEVVLQLAQAWKGISPETDAVIRHGCRSLLKQGRAEILNYYSLDSRNVLLDDYNIQTPQVSVGGDLQFSFTCTNANDRVQKIRLEYALYFLRSGGAYSKKVFKISEREYAAGERVNIQRRHSFRPITTRRYYAGSQRLAIILNGKEHPAQEFELVGEKV